MNRTMRAFVTIWLKPRATMRSILDDDPGRMVLTFSMLWAVSSSINTAMVRNHGDLFTVPLIMTLAVISAPSAGLIVLYIMSLYFAWIGRLIGGKGTAGELRTAFAWSSVPQVVALILTVIISSFFGSELFTSDMEQFDWSLFRLVLFEAYLFVVVVLQIWAVIMYIKLIAEAHRFSSWRALLTMLSWPLLLGLLFLVAYMVIR